MRRGHSHRLVALLLSWLVPATTAWASPPPLAPCEDAFWGGKRYTRTTGAPDVFVETVSVPPSVQAPYRLTVVNGDAQGDHRVSSARIEVNDVEVLSPSDFSQQVATLVREVALTPTTTLKVTLASAPGSYLTLSLCGQAAADRTPPTIAVAEPPAGALLGDATPLLRVTYADAPGTGETTASGVDTATLVVLVDGQDRTSWFTKGESEATAEVPADAALAEGGHRLEARIRDRAGNEATATPVEFRVDSLPPVVTITQPQDGVFVAATEIDVTGTVSDASPIVRLRVGGVDADVTGGSFSATAVPIGAGPEVTLEAEAEDAAGNVGRATVHLRVDRMAPTVRITRPRDGDTVQGPLLEVEGTVDDDSDVRVEVNGTPEDVPASLHAPRGFLAHVPITEGTTVLVATARDAAGNTGSASVTVRTDTVAPVVVITQPEAGFVTKEDTLRVAGTATDASAIVSVTVAGVPVTPGADGSFEAEVPTGGEGDRTIVVAATDAAGNTGTASVPIVVDRTAPTFSIASPDAGALLGGQPVVLQGTVEDPNLEGVTVDGAAATVTGLAWQVSIAGLADGAHTFTATARDRAANETVLTRTLTLDTGVPVLTITAPADGTLLRDDAVAVTGTVRDATLQSLTVNGAPAALAGDAASPDGAAFSVPALPLAEGANAIEAVARDAFDRSATARVDVVRDSTPPVVELTAPDRLVRGRAAKAVASATDGAGSGVAEVEFLIDGQLQATLGSPPFELTLEAPDTVASGQTMTVSARAKDLAGNVGATVSRVVAIVSEGVVVGQVLADETSLPLSGATVSLGAGSATSDARGRYALPAESASALVVAAAAGRTSVERELPVTVGTGAVPVDARLTRLAVAVSIGPGGGGLNADAPGLALAIAIPSGALAADTGVRLTPVSAQGLPGLLPLGWSPLLAFDLRVEGGAALVGPLPTTVKAGAGGTGAGGFPGWPDGPAHLAEYSRSLHAWVLVEPGLVPSAGELAFALPGPGAFALVIADAGDPAPPVPALGGALTGVPLAALPATAASRGLVEPAILPPAGGTADGTLVVDSPLPLPSGTVVQARVSETFSLASGEIASEDERAMDIVLFRAPCTGLGEAGGVTTTCPAAGAAAIAARVPLTPSRSFGTTELVEGKVHLDILAGRESARGTTGGAAPVVVESGAARLAVAALALPRDTAIAIRAESELSAFLPSDAGLEPVAEAVVDLSGQELALPAELSVVATGADGTYVVARVERVDGIPRLAVVAAASRVGDRLVTEPSSILPGVRREGRHVFYRLAVPVGFVRGVTQTDSGPMKAVITADGLPFVAASEPGGAYVLTTLPGGAVLVRARIPGTPLQGEGGPVAVVAGEATGLDITLGGAATTARVSPPNGASGIAVNVRLEVVPTLPFDPASVATAEVRLVRTSDGQPVPVRQVLAFGGRSLSVIPERKVGDEAMPLEFATAYTLTASGLRDTFGNPVGVPVSTFTTVAFVAPVLDVSRLVFAAPDENGIVKVTATAGSFPPGTTVLIVNSGNGVVLSLTADNEGAVDGELPASVEDRLLVTVTDPQGSAKTFERSQYLIDPATGETAVGAGGGIVTSPDAPGYELRVPEDATGQAVRLKIKALLESDFPELPALPGAEFGAGLEVNAPQRPTFEKEVDLAFPLASLPPLPADAKPEHAYYAVVREIKGAGGETYFQTIDEARVECPDGQTECDPAEKKVVTASFPFPGMVTSFGGLTASFGLVAVETTRYLLMRTFDAALPGRSQWGAITGRVVRPVPVPGKPGQYTYEGVAGCSVRREGLATGEVLAETSPAGDGLELGRLTFSAPWFTGGTVLLKATCDGRDYTGTAFVISGGAIEAIQDDGVKRLLASGHYQTIGFVNITLPVAAEPKTAPRVEIRVFREDAEEKRTDTGGAIVAGTTVQVGVRATGYVVRDLKIRGESQTLLIPDPLKRTKPKDPLAMDAILQDAWTPSVAGSYVIAATAMDPAELTTVTGETVVQVLQESGGATVSVPGQPGVIAGRTVPRDDARGVSVSVFPQLSFTEPVRNIRSTTVRLVPVGCAPPPEGSTSTAPSCTDSSATEANPGDAVPLRILAVTPDSRAIVIDDAEVPPPFVVSLTLQPLVSLSFGTTYRLDLTAAIADEDGELLVPYTSRFSTFLPEEVGQSKETDPPSVTGLVVLGERGYVLETLHGGGVAGPQQQSFLRVYDLTDPAEPRDLTDPATGSIPRRVIGYPPRDIAGEELKADDGSATGQKLIAVATAPRTFYQVQGSDPYWTELKSTPGNLFLYDVSEPDQAPRWAGAANITNNLVDGIPNRLFMQAGKIYAATFPKGIQIISVENLRLGFPAEGEPTGTDAVDLNKKLFAGGLNPGAIVLTVPVKDPGTGLPMPLNDLEVMDLQVWGVPRKVVVATGSRRQAGLVLADAISPYMEAGDTAPKPLWLGPLSKDADSLEWGAAIALTKIGDVPYALVGGYGVTGGGSQSLLAIVDLRPVAPAVAVGDPKPSPQVVAFVPLPKLNGIGDILLVGNTAIVSGGAGTTIDGRAGGAALVDLTDPEDPGVTGYVPGIASRMGIDANGVLLSSDRSYLKGTGSEPSGVRTAALGTAAVIQKVTPVIVPLDTSGLTTAPIRVTYRLIAPPSDLAGVTLALNRDAERLGAYAGPGTAPGTFDVVIPSGLPFKPPVERLELSLRSADSSPGDGVVAYVKDQSAAEGSIVVNPVFERLSPGLAAKGSGAASVRIEGRSLGGMSAVFVRRVAGAPPEGAAEAEEGQSVDEWTVAKVVSGDQTSIRIELPPEVLADEGFLLIAPVADPERGLAFVVFDTAAPAAGSSPDIRLTAVLPGELGTPGTSLHVEGSGFADGVVAVVGRGGRMAQRLETVAEDATSLDVALPPEYLGSADDLFLAVLSPDGSSLSNGLPVTSPVREVDKTVPLGVEPGEVAITGVGGSLVWDKPGQELTLEGAGLTPGMEILLTAGDSTASLFAQVAGAGPKTSMRASQAATPATIAKVKVLLPDTYTKWPTYCLELGLDFLSTTKIPMAVRCIGAQWPAFVPVGGRRKFVAYAGNDDQVYIFPVDDPEVGKATQPIPAGGCVGPKRTSVASARATGGQRLSPLLPEDVVFEFSVPSIDHPFGDPTQLDRIPLVEQEYNRCDPENPNVLYLRGVRPNAPGEEFEITARPGVRPPLRALREGRLKVAVGLGQLSGASPVSAKLDKKINQAGGATGVPPQLLKGQALVETKLNADLYRYEPMTIDFLDLASEGAKQRKDPYYRRHLLFGTAVATYDERQCAALRGPEAPDDPEPGCTPVDATQAHIGPVAFADPSVRVRGRVDLPIVGGQFNPGWRKPPISANRVYTIQGVTQIADPTRIEPRFHSDAQPKPPVTPVNDKEFNRGPRDNEYQVDFMNNTVRLGQPLARGEWVRLTYKRMFEQTVGPAAGDPDDAGRCGLDFDVTTLTDKTEKYNGPRDQKRGLSFQRDDSIGSFLRRNASDQGRFAQQGGINPGGGPVFRWLNGTDSEKRIEFARDDNGARTSTVIDPRFEMATAQFIAAGSFGLYQATLKDWDNIDHRAEILNRVFDLNNRCLFELMTNTGSRYREASLLAGARHSWARKQKRAQYTCDTPGRCDQVDWAKRWSKILWLYNTAGEEYNLIKRDSKGKPIGTKLFNTPVERGVEDFDVR